MNHQTSALNLEAVAIKASVLFTRLEYQGQSGRIIWLVAGLVESGLLSNYQLDDVVNSVRHSADRYNDPVNRFCKELAVHFGGESRLAKFLARIDLLLPADCCGPPDDSVFYRQAQERRTRIQSVLKDLAKTELEPLKISIG